MSEKIEPALSANLWRTLPNGVRGITVDDGRLYAKADRESGVPGIPAISVVPDEEPAAAIALLNSLLTDSDRRKITRAKVDLLWDAIDIRRRESSCVDPDNEPGHLALFELHDALASYLPPET